MSAGSLCTPCGKATVLPVGTIVTSLHSVSYKPSLDGTVRQRERACRSQLEKDKFLPVLGRRADKSQDHLQSLTRRSALPQFGGNSGIASPSFRGSEAP